MKDYVEQTEHASRSLIDLISADQQALSEANDKLKRATAKFEINHQVFIASEFHPAANHYHTQLTSAHKEKEEVERKVSIITAEIDAKSASISALSGALLQLAKQGISLTYGRPENTPKGEDISDIPVKEIIWEGRNQSTHYENPKEVSDKVVDLFARIDAVRDNGVSWEPRNRINYAFDVIRFLGWLDWSCYERHMISMRKR